MSAAPDLKAWYHSQGFNIVEMSPVKIPIDINGKNLTGPIVTELKPLEDYVLRATNWGIRHSLDPACDNVIFFDWDKGIIPDKLKQFMLTSRRKGEQTSYHGVVRVSDADGAWCRRFVAEYGMDGLEIFSGNKNLAMFGTYSIKTGGVSAWDWVDSLKEHEKIITVGKARIGAVFSGHRKSTARKTAPVVIPAGQGLRHQALIDEVRDIVGGLPKGSRTIDIVCNNMMQSTKIEGLSEYMRGGAKHQELQNIVDWIIKTFDDNVAFGSEVVKKDFRLAHVEGMMRDRYNCWAWQDGKWHEDADHKIMVKLKHMQTLKISTNLAIEISKLLSGDDQTLQVNLGSKEYRESRMSMIVLPDGKYYDLHEGRLKEIDPSYQFFEGVDMESPADMDAETPEVFIEFLKARFGANWEIVRDHMAGTFLHADMLGSRPKALTLAGKTGTYKSTLIDIFKNLFTASAKGSTSLKQLTGDNFGKALIANKIINAVGENNPRGMEHQEVFKEVVTDSAGEVRGMHSTKLIPVYRWPRWILATNKLAPIGQDDEDNSIFDRVTYVETLPVLEEEKDWRECFKDVKDKQAIMMYLLRRAHEIHVNPEGMHTQSREDTRVAYARLTTGDLEIFLGLDEKTKNKSMFRPAGNTIGVGYIETWNLFKQHVKSSMSKTKFNEMLESLGMEKSRCRTSMAADGSHTYELVTEGAMVTVIWGLRRIDGTSDQPPSTNATLS